MRPHSNRHLSNKAIRTVVQILESMVEAVHEIEVTLQGCTTSQHWHCTLGISIGIDLGQHWRTCTYPLMSYPCLTRTLWLLADCDETLQIPAQPMQSDLPCMRLAYSTASVMACTHSDPFRSQVWCMCTEHMHAMVASPRKQD